MKEFGQDPRTRCILTRFCNSPTLVGVLVHSDRYIGRGLGIYVVRMILIHYYGLKSVSTIRATDQLVVAV
jgi:hypothetical protein